MDYINQFRNLLDSMEKELKEKEERHQEDKSYLRGSSFDENNYRSENNYIFRKLNSLFNDDDSKVNFFSNDFGKGYCEIYRVTPSQKKKNSFDINYDYIKQKDNGNKKNYCLSFTVNKNDRNKLKDVSNKIIKFKKKIK